MSALIERDSQCCQTIRHNQSVGCEDAREWPLLESDVETIDFRKWLGTASVVCGGPPCQPFSLGGKGAGHSDRRDMFPQAVRAVREIAPKAFVFENVRGLLRPAFSNYVSYIRLQLTYPDVARKTSESAEQHLRRLERCHSSDVGPEPRYMVEICQVNAANYGVPQSRERIFIVGFRHDLHIEWNFPEATHSQSVLEKEKLSGQYYRRHRIAGPEPLAGDRQIEKPVEEESGMASWRTLRDGIQGLGEPGTNEQFSDHQYVPGARIYKGHTGSELDFPAKTIKAGDHGVPGGENMVVLDDRSVRYLTVRESARIQTFPDDFRFPLPRTASMRQLGNAVPCELATVVMRSVADAIQRKSARHAGTRGGQ